MSLCESTIALEGIVCATHGGAWIDGACLTRSVLEDVARHRQEQFETHGANRDLADGTGPEVPWLAAVVSDAVGQNVTGPAASEIEALFRQEWDFDRDPGQPYTWLQMLREEFAETAATSDPDALETELTQVAALAVSWIEKIRERRAGAPLGGI